MAKKRKNTSLDRILTDVRCRFADLTPGQLEALIDEAVATERAGVAALMGVDVSTLRRALHDGRAEGEP